MKKHYSLHLIICFVAMFCGSMLLAQPPKQNGTKPAAKFNPALVKSYLGKFSGKASVATVSEGKQIIALPLRIVDDKNVSYDLSSYQFAYTKWGPVEDEVTHIVSQKSTLSADRFTASPLPEIWQTNITDFLHTGEEFYFYDIIAFDKAGNRFFAPEIKIMIQ